LICLPIYLASRLSLDNKTTTSESPDGRPRAQANPQRLGRSRRAGDSLPQPDLHTDRCACEYLRLLLYIYASPFFACVAGLAVPTLFVVLVGTYIAQHNTHESCLPLWVHRFFCWCCPPPRAAAGASQLNTQGRQPAPVEAKRREHRVKFFVVCMPDSTCQVAQSGSQAQPKPPGAATCSGASAQWMVHASWGACSSLITSLLMRYKQTSECTTRPLLTAFHPRYACAGASPPLMLCAELRLRSPSQSQDAEAATAAYGSPSTVPYSVVGAPPRSPPSRQHGAHAAAAAAERAAGGDARSAHDSALHGRSLHRQASEGAGVHPRVRVTEAELSRELPRSGQTEAASC
jgi:hypothetical protein